MRQLQPVSLIALLLASLCTGCAVGTFGDNWAALSRPPSPDDVAAARKEDEPVALTQATATAQPAAATAHEEAVRIRALPECPEHYLGNAGTSTAPGSEGGAVVLTSSPDSGGETVVLVDPAGNHTSCHANSAHVARAKKYSVPPECPEHYVGKSLDAFPDSEGETVMVAKGACHVNPAHLAREQKYVEDAIPSRLPKCPEGYHERTFITGRLLPDGKGEIAELPNGKLCYANSAQVAHEEGLDAARHAKWVEKCERSEFARRITTTLNPSGRCWTSRDGCGQTVSETCAN